MVTGALKSNKMIKQKQQGRPFGWIGYLFLLLGMFVWTVAPQQVQAASGSGCATSTSSSGSYMVTLCFTAPVSGSTLTGAVTVTPSYTVSKTSPSVNHMIYFLDGKYLLTDFQKPFPFSLPSFYWVDGSHTLSFEAVMSDGYVTSNKASIHVKFKNGITSPPVNTKTYKPTLGTKGSPEVVVAVGDGSGGQTSESNVTSLISSLRPNLLLYLGDVYEDGSSTEFYNWYGNNNSFYSRFRSITNPTIGNHEYLTSGAAGFFYYWNNAPTYYSYNVAGWHIITLNSNSQFVQTRTGSAQYNWLVQDLASDTSKCTLVTYHAPLYNIGNENPATQMKNIWGLLAQDKVTLVVNGHDHDYQRYVPLDGSGNPSATGVTEIVDGTGGQGIDTFKRTDSRLVVGFDSSPTDFGVLRLQLNSTNASFKFIDTAGSTLDSGTVPCTGG